MTLTTNIMRFSKNNVCLVVIPKVASRTLTHLFRNILEWHYRDATKDGTYFGLIREPIERWVSGICQYYGSGATGDNVKQSTLDNIAKLTSVDGIGSFVDVGIHDIHTEPQSWHWAGIPSKTSRFYKLNNIRIMVRDMGVVNAIVHKNSHREYKLKIDLRAKVKELLWANPLYVNKLRNLYSDDYNLFTLAK